MIGSTELLRLVYTIKIVGAVVPMPLCPCSKLYLSDQIAYLTLLSDNLILSKIVGSAFINIVYMVCLYGVFTCIFTATGFLWIAT